MGKPVWTDETRPAKKLKPYERNAKVHPPEQIEKIAASIREFGYASPILIDERDMVLAGHARLAEILLPGMEQYAKAVPVRVAHGLSKTRGR